MESDYAFFWKDTGRSGSTDRGEKMSKQNIFDNETFFEGYKKLREREVNANNLFEIPTLFTLLPELEGRRVLDLGCGSGERCIDYIRRGASGVVGIDISEKMLQKAREDNSHPKITYLNMPMEEISCLEGPFDVVISSLALHYVEDFSGVVKAVHSLLLEGGIFLFSQEHPFSTCRRNRSETGRSGAPSRGLPLSQPPGNPERQSSVWRGYGQDI